MQSFFDLQNLANNNFDEKGTILIESDLRKRMQPLQNKFENKNSQAYYTILAAIKELILLVALLIMSQLKMAM